MKIPPTFHLFVLLSHVGPNSQISISAMIMVALQNNDTDKNICNDNQNNLFFYLGHFPYVGHPFDAVADDKHWKKWCNVTNDSLTNRSSCLLWQNGRLNSIGETKWNRGGVEVDLEQWRGWQRQVPLRVVASSLATLPGLVPAVIIMMMIVTLMVLIVRNPHNQHLPHWRHYHDNDRNRCNITVHN